MHNDTNKKKRVISAGILSVILLMAPGCSKSEVPVTAPAVPSSTSASAPNSPTGTAPADATAAMSTSAKFLAWGQRLTPDFKAQLVRLAAAKPPGQDVEFTVPLNPEDYQALAKIANEDRTGQVKFRDEPDAAQAGTQEKKVHVYFNAALLNS